MAKDNDPELDDDSDGEGAGGAKGLLGRFSKKMLIIAGGGAAALLLLLGVGINFLFFSSSDADKPKMVGNVVLPVVPPQVVFYDMPDLVVNIQSADTGAPAYLKLSVALELAAPEEKPGIQALMPRIVDQFQSYLRELRIDDLHGSAGVLRVKEELLRRVNAAAAPYPVRDVLLKEMIVQ
ncbi:MAG TPA: flagellar basal body-associated FliL family protein [Rhizomicrobium sp.]|nr:flagellar basal body-associated FliL family protein [Rhizomicrobium sp.]